MGIATIDGVVIKQLVTHADERGFFRELIRCSDTGFQDGFGQLSHSQVFAGVAKAWHFHKRQYQWNYAATGLIKVVLFDARKDSPTRNSLMEFLAGENQQAKAYGFPPGVLHGYRCIHGPAQIIYVTSGTYDPDEEGRLPHDDPAPGYDWVKTHGIK